MQESAKALAQRVENAEQSFIAVIRSIVDCPAEDARSVMVLYRKLKVTKLNVSIGTITVIHGAYLDKATILNALQSIKS